MYFILTSFPGQTLSESLKVDFHVSSQEVGAHPCGRRLGQAQDRAPTPDYWEDAFLPKKRFLVATSTNDTTRVIVGVEDPKGLWDF